MANYSSTFIIDTTGGTLYAVDDLLSGVPAGEDIVSAIDTELGSTSWQTGTPSGSAIVSAINAQLGSSTWQAGAGDGDVVGPAASADSELALFNGTTGKLLKRSTGNGIPKLTSGIMALVTAPAGTLVGTTDLQTLTGKRLPKRVSSIASSLTPTPDVSLLDQLNITALAVTATFGEPIGTPEDGELLMYRVKDDGTARALLWDAIYREGVATLPTTTTVGKTTYVLCSYNAADDKWDVMAAGTTA